MNAWQSMFLGFIQGLTEFLPVSSSGHLLLFRRLFGLGSISPSFDVMLHIGTLLAVLICLRGDVIGLFKKPIKLFYLALATVPAVAAGLLLGGYIEDFFYSENLLWLCFLVTAALLLACEIIETRRRSRGKIQSLELKIENAAAMGMMQTIALIPGISRSGATIFGGVISGADRKQTATFSFLMSVPIILGSAILSLGEIDVGFLEMSLGILFAFIGGFIAIKIMLRVIGSANYKWFSLYLAAVSILSIFI